jgi:hypothetical protein
MEAAMDKIVIPIHSMVDVITNSSTELFVLDTEKSVEVVREILEEAIDLHNKATGENLVFDNVFEDPYLGSPALALTGWKEHYTSKFEQGIIIRGANDNSIPFWIQEFLESVFGWKNIERFHLG